MGNRIIKGRNENYNLIKYSLNSASTNSEIYDKKIFNLSKLSDNKKYLRVEDYELWLKMYLNGYKGYNLEDYLYKMRNDKNAINRRTFSNRINEARVKKIIYKKFNLSFRYKYKVYIPILKACIPKSIYKILYKIKNKKDIL